MGQQSALAGGTWEQQGGNRGATRVSTWVWAQGGLGGATRVGAKMPMRGGWGPSVLWHLLDGATFVLAVGSPPARWEEGAGLRRKRAVLAVLLHFLETYKGLLQEEESAGKVIKVGVPPHPAMPPPATWSPPP